MRAVIQNGSGTAAEVLRRIDLLPGPAQVRVQG
jgi:hypothetical protein